ncbi:methyl-accepting chemotaxis protein [Ectothiorhodospiraceae bacterium WFHF3C12]|nr:methyl-accepting chemotaxis protein [Ectothiorhodospiraceae bacterium WFHF3C12]
MGFGRVSGSILGKLLATTGLGTLLFAGAAIFGIYGMWSSLLEFKTLGTTGVAQERMALKMERALESQLRDWKNLLIRGNSPEAVDRQWDKFLSDHERLDTLTDELLASVGQGPLRQPIVEFRDGHASMLSEYRAALEQFRDSGYDASAADEAVENAATAERERLNAIQQAIAEDLANMTAATTDGARTAFITSLIAMAAAGLAAFAVFVILVRRQIIAPAQLLVDDLERLADGDFSRPVEKRTDDELGQVAEAAAEIRARLGRLITDVTDAVSQVAAAAEELSAVASKSKEGVERQRSETDQVATAMNQMTSTVQEVARNASEAAKATGEADQHARGGQDVVARNSGVISELAGELERSGEVIGRLQQDSGDIGAVLHVIQEVAEQTNLLALNAAIEAARAGEQGRGFAVVADEVRALAQRTQQSTAEIQDIIERIQSGTENTVKAMEQSRSQAHSAVDNAQAAGEALNSIAQAVSTINDMNSQIASAAEEQSSVSEEINRNIATIHEVADESARSVEQTSNASDELARLASELQSLAQRFKVR